MGIKPKIPKETSGDLEFVQQALNNKDQRAFAHLMEKYWDSLYFMILKMVKTPEDAEDLALETFHKAFKSLDKYVPQFAFSTWLFRIGTNTTIDFLRTKKIDFVAFNQTDEKDDSVQLLNGLVNDISNPEEKFIKKQRSSLLKKAIEEIDPVFSVLIQLRYFNEYSYEEIAQSLNMPLGTVKVQLHRAKKRLYELLKNRKDAI